MTTSELLLAAVGLCVFLALYQRSVRQILVELFAGLRDAMGNAAGAVDAGATRVRRAAGSSLAALGLSGDRWRASYVSGALMASIVFAGLAWCEWGLVLPSLQALFGEGAGNATTAGPGALMGGAILLSGIFGVWFAHEVLSNGHLLPIEHFTGWARKVAIGSGLAVGTLSLASGVALGFYRAAPWLDTKPTPAAEVAIPSQAHPSGLLVGTGGSEALAMLAASEPGMPTPLTETERIAAVVVTGALPASLFLATVLAWDTGPAMLLKLAPAGLLGTLAALLALVAGVLRTVLTGTLIVWGVLDATLRVCQRVGITLARPLVMAVRELNAWARARRERPPSGSAPDPLGASVRAATAWAADVELPEDGVGARPTIDLEANDEPTRSSGGSGADQPGGGARQQVPGDADAGVDDAEDGPQDPPFTMGGVSSHAWDPFMGAPEPTPNHEEVQP